MQSVHTPRGSGCLRGAAAAAVVAAAAAAAVALQDNGATYFHLTEDGKSSGWWV